MPPNIPGILVPFQLLIHPRLIVPSLRVKDIRQIDFTALRKAGYKGAVFDKDNCLTLPYRDTLVPELEEAWKSCRETFGQGNILIVSNSAGTQLDTGHIQSESVQHHLQVPVLSHKSFKPSYSCIAGIRSYFSSLPSPVFFHELIIVGDRVFTDVVLANRMRIQAQRRQEAFPQLSNNEKDEGELKERENNLNPRGPLAIWTTSVWERESMLMRWMESSLVKLVEKWSSAPSKGQSPMDTSRFIRDITPPQKLNGKRSSFIEELWTIFRRT